MKFGSFVLMLLAAAACGDDGTVGGLPDAPVTVDAPADSPVDGTASLRVVINGMPTVGMPVYFHRADGSLVSPTRQTDANGMASGQVEATGSFVTLGLPAFNAAYTWSHVMPGAALVLGTPAQSAHPIHLSIPKFTGATVYGVTVNCRGFEVSLTDAQTTGLDTQFPCPPPWDLMVTAGNGLEETQQAFFVPQVSPDANQNVALAGVYSPATSTTANFTNVPLDTDNVVTGAIIGAKFSGGGWTKSQIAPHADGTATRTFTLPSVGQPILYSDELQAGGLDLVQLTRVAAPLATRDVDWNTYAMTHANAGPTFDVATRTMSWTEAQGTVSPELLLVVQQIQRPNVGIFQRNIIGPYTSGATTLPQIPIDTLDWNVNPTDTVISVVAMIHGGKSYAQIYEQLYENAVGYIAAWNDSTAEAFYLASSTVEQ